MIRIAECRFVRVPDETVMPPFVEYARPPSWQATTTCTPSGVRLCCASPCKVFLQKGLKIFVHSFLSLHRSDDMSSIVYSSSPALSQVHKHSRFVWIWLAEHCRLLPWTTLAGMWLRSILSAASADGAQLMLQSDVR